MKKIILGLGTGRCGTVSLSTLLNEQIDTNCIHEPLAHRATYKVTEKSKDVALNELRRRDSKIVGAVASHYLTYLNPIFEAFDDVEVISIYRDKKDVVPSFVKKVKQNGRNANHWMAHDGKRWKYDKWDACFPKFKAKTIEESISKYYDFYYDELDKICNRLGILYHRFKTNDLNDSEKTIKLLKDLGYNQPIYKKIKKNSI